MKVGDLVKIKDNQINTFGVSFGIVVKVIECSTITSNPTALVCWTPEGYEHWWECHRLEVLCE